MELWGVADTNTTTAGTEIGTETEGGLMQGAGLRSSNDAVATIIELKRRVERLEEGVGRLLVCAPFPPCPYNPFNLPHDKY